MGKRILLGSLVGSVVVFVVSAAWHMTPGLGQIGVKALPAEDTVLAGLRTSLHEPGFYYFPAPDMSAGRTKEQVKADEAAYLERNRRGPSGILVYRPGSEGGEELRFGKLMAYQFLFGLAGSFIIAWILALTAGSTTFGSRAWLVLLIALFGGIVYALPEWNWYGSPASYTIASIASMLVSWGIAGLAMAAIVKRPAAG
jgi:hypothetical protein